MSEMGEVHAVVVDDDAISADVLLRLLRKEGASCAMALDATQAIHAVETLKVDVVFLDLDMGVGKTDGYRILDLLRDNPNIGKAVFIAYTAHLSEMTNARNVGFDGFIGKPLVATDFHKQWENILRGKPVWAIR